MDNSYNNNLIGINKNDTINAYYKRDLGLNIDNATIITDALKKLGYFNINANTLEIAYIKKEIFRQLKRIYDNDITLNDILGIDGFAIHDIHMKILNSVEFNKYRNHINDKIARCNDLMPCIAQNNILEFYSKLTLEELNYLGY